MFVAGVSFVHFVGIISMFHIVFLQLFRFFLGLCVADLSASPYTSERRLWATRQLRPVVDR